MYGGHRDYGNADAKNKEEESKLSNSRKVINEDLDKYMNYHNPSTDCMDFSQYRMHKSPIESKDISIPKSIEVRPLGPDPYSGAAQDVNIINYGEFLVRCAHCRAYMNPFVQFSLNEWKCSLCYAMNHTGLEHFKNHKDKPEFKHGTVEFQATQAYMQRPPMPATYLFCFDVTKSSIETGYLELAATTLKSVIENGELDGDSRTLIGFLTYDTNINYYYLGTNVSAPQMYTVRPFSACPIPNKMLLCNLEECMSNVLSFLDCLPNMFQGTITQGSCFVRTISVANNILKNSGGKLILFQSCSSLSQDKNIHSVQNSVPGLNKLLTGGSTFFRDLGAEMGNVSQIGIYLFLFATSFKNLASLSNLCEVTGGEFFYYPYFNSKMHGLKFRNEFYRNLTIPHGWEGFFRVRISRGFKIKEVMGNYSFKSTDLISFPCVTSDKTILYIIDYADEHEEINKEVAIIQAALLYSTSFGERRIRVHTAYIPLTDNLGTILNYANLNLIFRTYSMMAIQKSRQMLKITEGRDLLEKEARAFVAGIKRSSGAFDSTNFQSNIPPNLEYSFVYFLGTLKNCIFLSDTNVANVLQDLMNYQRYKMYALPSVELMGWIYPQLLPVLDIDELEPGQLPALTNLYYSSMNENGIYMLDAGRVIYLWIGNQLNSSMCLKIFKVHKMDMLRLPLAESDIFNEESILDPYIEKLYGILNTLRQYEIDVVSTFGGAYTRKGRRKQIAGAFNRRQQAKWHTRLSDFL